MMTRIAHNRLTHEQILNRFYQIHGNSYDYSDMIYTGTENKIKIKCNRCQRYFYQKPVKHQKGQGCPYCNRAKNKLTQEEFIRRGKERNGDMYDYSKVVYINSNEKVLLHCNICGRDFYQLPASHLRGCKCKFCANEENGKVRVISEEDWLNRFIKVHGNCYEYLDIPLGITNKIKLRCKKCNRVFEQGKQIHLAGSGCPYCNTTIITKEKFLKIIDDLDFSRYEYNLDNYTKADDYIDILCKKCKHTFRQKASKHLRGQGCPYCKQSKGEKEIEKYLVKNNVEYLIQYKFNDCKDKNPLPFDFYLPTFNLCIEYQGLQHYEPKLFLALYKNLQLAIKAFETQQKHDQIKRDFCKNNNIKLLEITYKDDIVKKLNKELNSKTE